MHVHVPHHSWHNNVLCAAKLTEGHLALGIHMSMTSLWYVPLYSTCVWNIWATPLFTHLHLFEVQGTVVHFNQLFQHLSSVVHGGHHDQCASITTHKEGIWWVELAHIQRTLQCTGQRTNSGRWCTHFTASRGPDLSPHYNLSHLIFTS